MSGGKETPRQKMIGMMYLVLTALLALNVSKQIVAAFITINDKLEASNDIIDHKSGDVYFGFNQKRAALTAMNGNTEKLVYWENKAISLKSKTAEIVGFLMNECNDMIKESEGEDWVEEKDEAGNIVKLKPLMKIAGMDNYDIPTNMFVGGNPSSPNERGMNIREMIHIFRNEVCSIMGSYKEGNSNYSFEAPANEGGLHDAMLSANPKDTSKLRQFYTSLTIPDKIASHDHDATLMPWSSVMFDHAPIVAAAALFTSLKLDVKNAESLAAEYMLAKVDAPMFNFNKITPLPFAGASYINQGDSMMLNVLIAAVDTNNVAEIRYGIDDSIPGNWKTTTGGIKLNSQNPGQHSVTGQIGIEQQGEITWKNWGFDYTVGQPMGVVSLPELNVLYKGYDNEVLGTASGFPQDKISLSGSGCKIQSKGGKYYAIPNQGVRNASISVVGKKDDGSTLNLGTMNFRVLTLPKPNFYLGQLEEGAEVSKSELMSQTRMFVRYDSSVPLNATFGVSRWTLSTSNAPRSVSGTGSVLSAEAKNLLRNVQSGGTVTFMVIIKYPNGETKRKAVAYSVR